MGAGRPGMIGPEHMQDWTDQYVNRRLSAWTTPRVSRQGWTPNAVTTASRLLGLAAAACYAAGWSWAGAALLQTFMVGDCVDGDLARATGHVTPWGDLYDHVGDDVVFLAVAAGLATQVSWDLGLLHVVALAVALLLSGQQHWYNLEAREPGHMRTKRGQLSALGADGPRAALVAYYSWRLRTLERTAQLLNPRAAIPGTWRGLWPWRFAGISTLSALVVIAGIVRWPDLVSWGLVTVGLPYFLVALRRQRGADA